MTNARTYPHGVPCWIDTIAHDLETTTAFYRGLFGWSFTDAIPPEAPGNYLIATLDGRDVAAIASPDAADEAVTWRTYIAVDDADAAARRVVAAGGRVTLDPVDAGPGGRQAGCQDPGGAEFRLWQARRRLGAQRVNEPGTWNFSDLQTTDPEAAKSFYGPLFGWEFDDLGFATLIRRPGYGDHLAATVDPEIRKRQSEIEAPPGFADAIAWLGADTADGELWQVSFTVADRDASADSVRALGGTVTATEDTEWTKTAAVRDPAGARFVLSQFTPPAGG
jgi:hypothetical protein